MLFVDGAQRFLRYLGSHPGPDMTIAAAASLAGVRVGRARTLLAELCRADLVGETAPGRYAVREAGTQDQAALYRGLDHYLHSAFACARLLDPGRDTIAMSAPYPGVTSERPRDNGEALAWFQAEHAVLSCCLKAAVAARLDGYVWRLAWTMWPYLDRQGHWREMLSVGRAGLADAAKIGHGRGQAASHRLLSAAAARLGRAGLARDHLRCAFELYRRVGDINGEARTGEALASPLSYLVTMDAGIRI